MKELKQFVINTIINYDRFMAENRPPIWYAWSSGRKEHELVCCSKKNQGRVLCWLRGKTVLNKQRVSDLVVPCCVQE
jgi:hypothetical protein